MEYKSKTTSKNNVGCSNVSQEAADAQAVVMDARNCIGCTNCTDCTDCIGCYGCTDCRRCIDCTFLRDAVECIRCTDCAGCIYCFNCTHCEDCMHCRRCNYCTSCSDVPRWKGPAVHKLMSISGLYWSVSTDGVYMQIGCQGHTVKEWENFTDDEIDGMDPYALTFWNVYKDYVLTAARVAGERGSRGAWGAW